VQAAPAVNMLNRSLRDSFADRVDVIASEQGVKKVVAGKAAGHAGHAPVLFETSAKVFLGEPLLHLEAFGPGGVVVHCSSVDEAISCVESLGGNLTGTVHIGEAEDEATTMRVLRTLEGEVGRVIVNGYPTGVEVCHAIVHGGPFPATTDAGSTSVGSAAMRRFVRPVAYQNLPQDLLPPALQDDNPLGIWRLVNGKWSAGPLESPS
jgi:NADP-dependent aldehyde dehydrogenase